MSKAYRRPGAKQSTHASIDLNGERKENI